MTYPAHRIGNATQRYEFGEDWLQTSPTERDLAVLVDNGFSRTQQGT